MSDKMPKMPLQYGEMNQWTQEQRDTFTKWMNHIMSKNKLNKVSARWYTRWALIKMIMRNDQFVFVGFSKPKGNPASFNCRVEQLIQAQIPADANYMFGALMHYVQNGYPNDTKAKIDAYIEEGKAMGFIERGEP